MAARRGSRVAGACRIFYFAEMYEGGLIGALPLLFISSGSLSAGPLFGPRELE